MSAHWGRTFLPRLVKQKDGRRNRYQVQTHLPLPEPTSQKRTVGEVLALLVGTDLIGG